MLSEFAAKVDVLPSVLVDVRLAATEACTNVIQHAYPNRSIGMMDVIADADTTCIRVVVRDYGVGVDQAGGRHGGGMGLKIIEALTTLHSVDPCEPGTRTAMTFSLRTHAAPSV
jgi:anti-sigma regulatory factor (Ser/Thr protein kinase)